MHKMVPFSLVLVLYVRTCASKLKSVRMKTSRVSATFLEVLVNPVYLCDQIDFNRLPRVYERVTTSSLVGVTRWVMTLRQNETKIRKVFSLFVAYSCQYVSLFSRRDANNKHIPLIKSLHYSTLGVWVQRHFLWIFSPFLFLCHATCR